VIGESLGCGSGICGLCIAVMQPVRSIFDLGVRIENELTSSKEAYTSEKQAHEHR
jgi:hypothetical protein